jgi:hypothetical protein
VLYELAQRRIKQIEDKTKRLTISNNKDERSLNVIQLDNQALVINQVSKQKEILKGKFQLKISESLQQSHRIEKYAQEPVAYFLHKKRDFLQRLFKTKAMMEDREIIEY